MGSIHYSSEANPLSPIRPHSTLFVESATLSIPADIVTDNQAGYTHLILTVEPIPGQGQDKIIGNNFVAIQVTVSDTKPGVYGFTHTYVL